MNLVWKGLILVVGVSLSPQAKAQEWTGAYLGLDIGQNSARAATDSRGTAGFSAGVGGDAPGSAAQATSLTGNYDSLLDGPAFGAHLGYNWQQGVVVLGLEADVQRPSQSGTNTIDTLTTVASYPSNPLSASLSQTDSIDYLSTLRARLGYAGEQWLLYGTAGLAIGKVNSRVTYDGRYVAAPTIVFDDFNASFSDMRAGYVIGAGAEYALAEKWTVRAEYLYYDLGRSSRDFSVVSQVPATGFIATGVANASTKWAGSMVRLGISYRF